MKRSAALVLALLGAGLLGACLIRPGLPEPHLSGTWSGLAHPWCCAFTPDDFGRDANVTWWLTETADRRIQGSMTVTLASGALAQGIVTGDIVVSTLYFNARVTLGNCEVVGSGTANVLPPVTTIDGPYVGISSCGGSHTESRLTLTRQ